MYQFAEIICTLVTFGMLGGLVRFLIGRGCLSLVLSLSMGALVLFTALVNGGNLFLYGTLWGVFVTFKGLGDLVGTAHGPEYRYLTGQRPLKGAKIQVVPGAKLHPEQPRDRTP